MIQKAYYFGQEEEKDGEAIQHEVKSQFGEEDFGARCTIFTFGRSKEDDVEEEENHKERPLQELQEKEEDHIEDGCFFRLEGKKDHDEKDHKKENDQEEGCNSQVFSKELTVKKEDDEKADYKEEGHEETSHEETSHKEEYIEEVSCEEESTFE